ncbi:MAG: hypothetical protein V2A66_05665 [Pseudomonadota bacterium]
MKPLNKSWNDRISKALDLGCFISWNEGSEFIGELEEVHRGLVTLAKSRPREALGCFEIFLAGCLVKGNEVDDSSGGLGMFLEEIFQSWARCCSSAGMKPADFLRKIAHWMQVDDIGFCCDLERTIIPALSSEYRSALRHSLEQRLLEKPSNGMPEPERSRLLSQYRYDLSTLKKLLISTNNTTAIIEAGDRYGFTLEDCLALATAFSSRGQPKRALEWAERGLKCNDDRSGQEYKLEQLRRQLMIKTGRRSDAIQEAWKKFEQFPAIHSFKDVLACASRSDKSELTNKALILFEKADLQHAIEAFHELKQTDCLVRRIERAKNADLKQLFYSTAITTAKSIAKKFPSQTARLYVTQALAILDARKAKAYHHAHDYLYEAKTLMERAGEKELWDKLVKDIRHEHRLKSSFIPGFEEIAADRGPIRPPSFMERISSKLDR